MFSDIWDGGLEFIVDNNDFIWIMSHLRDMYCHGHNSWIIVWSSNMSNWELEHIWEWSNQTRCTFISNGENLCFCSINVSFFLKFLNISYDYRVNSTAKTFIRGNWDKDSGWILWFSWHFSLHKLITLENHVDSFITKIFTIC